MSVQAMDRLLSVVAESSTHSWYMGEPAAGNSIRQTAPAITPTIGRNIQVHYGPGEVALWVAAVRAEHAERVVH